MTKSQIAAVIRREGECCRISAGLNKGNGMENVFYGNWIMLSSLADRIEGTGMHAPKQTRESLEKQYKRFKRKYFKGRVGFTGLELEECKAAFMKKCKLTQQDLIKLKQ